MKRTLKAGSILLMVILMLVVLAGSIFAQRPIKIGGQKSSMVIMPVQFDCKSSEVANDVENATLDAVEKMGFEPVYGQRVERAMDALDIQLFPARKIGSSGEPLVSVNRRERSSRVSKVVLDEENLLKVGRHLRSDYAMGVVYKVFPKYTYHFPAGKRLNGRCIMDVIIIDVRRAEVIYECHSPEIGYVYTKDQDLKSAASIGGVLMATGVLGKGKVTRAVGWGLVAAPQLVKSGNEEDAQYAASAIAINTVLGEFYDNFRDRERRR